MTLFGRFFLGVLVLGAAELILLVKVARTVSFFGTVGLCVLTAMTGIALLKRQWLQTLRTVQTAIDNGQAPTAEIVGGLILLVAGALLILPGFISDGLAFLALIPPLRRHGAAWLARRLEGRIAPTLFSPGGPTHSGPAPRPARGRIIDIDPEE